MMVKTEVALNNQESTQYRINCFVGGENVGNCLCLLYHNGAANVALIDSVVIYRPHRGKGYGKELMREAIEFARTMSADSVELTVNRGNKIARHIYQTLGFEDTGKRYCRKILNEL